MSASPTSLPKVRASELTGRGWLNTGGRTITLADLRGKIVLLDFWTFCCINCLHVLDELRELEEQYRDVLVVVGVHSPKFVHEADPVALAAAVERYEVHHPVLDDPDLETWSAYAARAWPTLTVIDPEGYVVATMAGEGHKNNLAILLADLVAEHEAKGTLHRGDGPYVAPPATSGTLRFPAKAVSLPDGGYLVADAGHHSLAHLAADGETLLARIGSGERGFADGDAATARFAEPNGLVLVPEHLRGALDADVLVADTVNHALRAVRLSDGQVRTVAGTGEQFMVGASDNVVATGQPEGADLSGVGYDGDPLAVRLSSPWDVTWSDVLDAFVVAMAGNHTLSALSVARDGSTRIRSLAGTMNEGLLDGPAADAWFAQTSGLAVDADGWVWLADSEVSALRWLDPSAGEPVVGTAVGAGLFDFGFRDGDAAQALLQHPLGLAVLPDGSVLVADTYNGALRRFDPASNEVTTLARDLAEPSDVLVQAGADGAVEVVVVESAAHRLTRIALPADLAGTFVDGGAHRTQRPVTELAPGALSLEVVFTPAAGQKYDDRYGPSTSLQVSSTPPELLLEGAGSDGPLLRQLVLNPDVVEGVLHVTAKAASCDADDAVEFPACHLNAQDWGVPVRVAPGGASTLVLPLHG